MLTADSTKTLSFKRCIRDGDLVIVYERHDVMKPVNVSEKGVLQNRFGVFKHSDWIGKPFGSKAFSNKGGFVYLLAPTPELWTLVLSHRTQILYIADISFVVMYLEIVPGCVVLESGTGSGSLSTSLARVVAPNGHVYTFDFHEQRAVSAREDFERTGLSSLVTVGVRDVQGEGFPDEFLGRADSVFLDLPQPWLAIPSAARMLQQDGVLCSFSPCIEQVQRSCETLKSSFTDIRTFEVLLHTYEVREGHFASWQDNNGALASARSCKKRQRSTDGQENSQPQTVMARRIGEARGHTGYLTFARLSCIGQSQSKCNYSLLSCCDFFNQRTRSLYVELYFYCIWFEMDLFNQDIQANNSRRNQLLLLLLLMSPESRQMKNQPQPPPFPSLKHATHQSTPLGSPPIARRHEQIHATPSTQIRADVSSRRKWRKKKKQPLLRLDPRQPPIFLPPWSPESRRKRSSRSPSSMVAGITTKKKQPQLPVGHETTTHRPSSSPSRLHGRRRSNSSSVAKNYISFVLHIPFSFRCEII